MSKLKFVPRWIRQKWFFRIVTLVNFVVIVSFFVHGLWALEAGNEGKGYVLMGAFIGGCLGIARGVNKRRIYRKQGYRSKPGLFERKKKVDNYIS